METGMTLDELHDNDDAPEVTGQTDENNLDDNQNSIDNSDDTSSNTGDTADNSNEDEEESPLEDNNTPGIEQFLAQYGVVGGMISFEDGESKHFDTLSESEKYSVLHDLSQTTSPDLEAQYGLDDEEVNLINWLREQDEPLQESIEKLAQQRVDQLLALSQSGATDYTDMSEDAVMMRWLQNNDPEASEEDLAEELTRQKESKFYGKNVERLRDQFVADQQGQVDAQRQAEYQAHLEEIEGDRTVIASAMQNTNQIAGFDINDEEKNTVLHDLLEVNQEGDSLFMEEVFSNPDNLIKAAWLYKNAEKYMDELETYYKKLNAQSYQAGKSDAMNGLSKSPISGMSNAGKPSSTSEPVRAEQYKTLDELHEND